MGRDITLPLPRLEYKDALERFGTDKPDTRFSMEIVDITDIVRDSDFKVFRQAAQGGGAIKAIKVKKRASEFSRKSLDELSGVVISEGAKGLVFAKVKDSGWQSSIDKFLDAQQKESINKRLNAGSGDLLLMRGSSAYGS
ncbi:MAG: hypothetical protein JRI84_04890 [Deltaproteobacteria bacterium]|nr:hypothetical protein [Deltaproteobacteria bacterium]